MFVFKHGTYNIHNKGYISLKNQKKNGILTYDNLRAMFIRNLVQTSHEINMYFTGLQYRLLSLFTVFLFYIMIRKTLDDQQLFKSIETLILRDIYEERYSNKRQY